jgi:hypothetical protein
MPYIKNIIMNPPYDGVLHLDFLKTACGIGENWIHADNVVSVQPANWLYNQRPNSNTYKIKQEFVAEKTNIVAANFFNGNAIFAIGSFVPLAIITVSNTSSSQMVSISETFWNGLKTTALLPLNKIHPFLNNNTNTFESLSEKIKVLTKNNIWDNSSQEAINDHCVPISYVQGGKSETLGFLHHQDFFALETKIDVDDDGIMTKENFDKQAYTKDGDVREGSKSTPHFSTRQEAVNFTNYLKTDFVIYCLMMYKDTQNVNHGKITKYIPFMHDYTQPWTDNRIYQHMNFNQEQISYIQEMVNRWKSSKQ